MRHSKAEQLAQIINGEAQEIEAIKRLAGPAWGARMLLPGDDEPVTSGFTRMLATSAAVAVDLYEWATKHPAEAQRFFCGDIPPINTGNLAASKKTRSPRNSNARLVRGRSGVKAK